MNDQMTEVALIAAGDLALSVRDDGPEYVALAAQKVLDACGGDAIAALSVTAALVRVDMPIDAWWQRGLDGLAPRAGRGRPRKPCGTHAAFIRHKKYGEPVDDACAEAQRKFDRERKRRARAAA